MNLESLFENGDEFRSFSLQEKVKVVAYGHYLNTDSTTFTPSDLVKLFQQNNLDAPSNMSRELSVIIGKKPRDIFKIKNSYVLERSFIQRMNLQYQTDYSKAITVEMTRLLHKINDQNQKKFLEDALRCYNKQLYRPAIIMTWIVVLDILYDYILNQKLVEFNTELSRLNKKIQIFQKADFEDIKESVFIEILRSSSIISKEQKKILDDKLTIRNSAAHPNQTSFKEPKVASFIEELLVDIVDKIR